MDYRRFSWICMDFHGISWNFMEFHRISSIFFDFHRFSLNFIDFGRHLGGIWEASGRSGLPGGSQGPPGYHFSEFATFFEGFSVFSLPCSLPKLFLGLCKRQAIGNRICDSTPPSSPMASRLCRFQGVRRCHAAWRLR